MAAIGAPAFSPTDVRAKPLPLAALSLLPSAYPLLPAVQSEPSQTSCYRAIARQPRSDGPPT